MSFSRIRYKFGTRTTGTFFTGTCDGRPTIDGGGVGKAACRRASAHSVGSFDIITRIFSHWVKQGRQQWLISSWWWSLFPFTTHSKFGDALPYDSNGTHNRLNRLSSTVARARTSKCGS